MVALIAFALLIQREPDFGRLFPHPTGTNGYEEYVKASDLLVGNPNFDRLEKSIAKLGDSSSSGQSDLSSGAEYLSVVSEEVKDFSPVSDLIEQGNQKSVVKPEAMGGDESTWLGNFRTVAKFETNAAYLAFADGRSIDGIKILGDTVAFAQNISATNVMHRLVGTDCESTVLVEMDRQLNRFSLADARSIEAMSRTILSRPALGKEALANDEPGMSEELAKFVEQPGDFLSSMLDIDLGKLSDDERHSLSGDIDKRCRETFQQAESVLGGPESDWATYADKRKEDGTPTDLAQKFVDNISLRSLIRMVVLDEATLRTRYHLLWLHSKILEYRWLHGVLPPDLVQCAGPGADKDVIFGGQLNYRISGKAYTLSSRGGLVAGEISLKTDHRSNLSLGLGPAAP